MISLTEVLALPEDAAVDALCGLDAAARAELTRQITAAYDADVADRAAGGTGMSDRDGSRVRLARIASAPAELAMPDGAQEVRIAVSRGRRHLQAVADAAVRRLATNRAQVTQLQTLRRLERDGLIELPANDDTVLAVIGSLTDGWERLPGRPHRRDWVRAPRTSELLRDDGRLLDTVFWRIFEVDGSSEVSLANVDRYLRHHPGHTWREAVADLVAAGAVPRGRVLDATLGGLARATVGFRAGWFVAVHGDLAPTVEEIVARQPAYDRLLTSRLGPVVGVGLDALLAVRRAGLPVDAPSLPAAVHAPVKAVVLKALRLGGAPVAEAALVHPDADVRTAAAKLLGRHEPAAPPMAELPRTAAPHAASDSLAAVDPITDPAELAEAFAVLVEDPSDPDLIERALCAAARLGPDPERYGTLARRVRRRLAQDFDGLLRVVGGVVIAAAGGGPAQDGWVPAREYGLLVRRAAEVTAALRAGRRFAPLAEPTHAGGWVAPATLVRRLTGTGGHPAADTVAALLRLGPDPAGGAAVLGDAARVPGVVGAALRFALGGPCPDTADPVDRPLWIAAARARAPHGDADGAGYTMRHDEYGGIVFAPVAPAGDDEDPLLPTATLAALTDRRAWRLSPAWLPWLGTVWPGNVEPVAAAWLTVTTGPRGTAAHGAAALRTVLAARGALPPAARLLVAAGLGAAALAERVAAVDAALDLVPHRLAPADLGDALAWWAPVVPANRWASSLRALAEAGRVTDVTGVLSALLPRLDRATTGLHGLVELLADTGAPATDPALRAWLATFTGSTKTARAAKTVLAR